MTSSSSSSYSSDEEGSPKTARTSATTTSTPTATAKPAATNFANSDQIKSALQSLSQFLSSPLPSNDPSAVYPHISALLRRPNSGSGDNNLCRWLYDTFQSNVPDLQLLVLRFVPLITGLYLSRINSSQAGFESVLLALYAHETASRAAQPVTVTLPDLNHSSVYHESKNPPSSKNAATDLNLAVVSSTLEPHGTIRSTRKARIVGVALELFFSKISSMPVESKVDFCEFCKIWAGVDGSMYKYFEEERIAEIKIDVKEKEKEKGKGKGKGKGGGKAVEETAAAGGRIPMPWELTQPVVRILAHCLMEPGNKDEAVFKAANEACRCLFARSMLDVNPMAILAMRSLLRLSKTLDDDFDPTELPVTDIITL